MHFRIAFHMSRIKVQIFLLCSNLSLLTNYTNYEYYNISIYFEVFPLGFIFINSFK